MCVRRNCTIKLLVPALGVKSYDYPQLFLFTSKKKKPVKYTGFEAIDNILAFTGTEIGLTYKKVTSDSYITDYFLIL